MDTTRSTRREALFAACYFALYGGYLFLHQEGELLHWLSLVVLPLGTLAVITRYPSARVLLRSIGLDASRAARGLPWVLALGGAFQVLQLMNRRQRAELVPILQEPFGFLVPLAAFALLIGTVATTEEVFFRGVLQTRLANYFRSDLLAIVVATGAFIVYHVPYAYLKPSWPSAGNLPHAIQLAAVNGGLGGVALGVVYWRSGHNLVAAMLLHALIDLIPATRLVNRMVSGTS